MTAKLNIVLNGIRNITLGVFAALGKSSSAHLNYVNETYELLILKERSMERSNLGTEVLGQLLNYFCKVSIGIIHSCNEEHSGKFLLFTHFPSLNGTYFNACLSVNYYYCSSCCIKCLLYFSYKVEITGTIKEIDLNPVMLYRNQRSADREGTLNLFFIIVTNGITFFNTSLT